MSDKDRELIEKGILADEWQDIKPLEDQAESEECKRILHNRKMYLYHREEQFSGLSI